MELQDHVWGSGYASTRWIGRPRDFSKPSSQGDDILTLRTSKKTGGLTLEMDPVNDECLRHDAILSTSLRHESILPSLHDPYNQSEISSLDTAIEGSAVEV